VHRRLRAPGSQGNAEDEVSIVAPESHRHDDRQRLVRERDSSEAGGSQQRDAFRIGQYLHALLVVFHRFMVRSGGEFS
jgi:hypothetical protein